MTASIATTQTVIVVGGGISGMTAALEAAECGTQVVLLERNPSLGGRTAMLYRYFPKLCHPTCGLEINLRRLKASRNLRVAHDGRSRRRHGKAGRLSRDGARPPALRQRTLHGLRRLRAGRWPPRFRIRSTTASTG